MTATRRPVSIFGATLIISAAAVLLGGCAVTTTTLRIPNPDPNGAPFEFSWSSDKDIHIAGFEATTPGGMVVKFKDLTGDASTPANVQVQGIRAVSEGVAAGLASGITKAP